MDQWGAGGVEDLPVRSEQTVLRMKGMTCLEKHLLTPKGQTAGTMVCYGTTFGRLILMKRKEIGRQRGNGVAARYSRYYRDTNKAGNLGSPAA